MPIDFTTQIDDSVTCESCNAKCCRLEVMLISDTGVPRHLVAIDKWGGMIMNRLDDGWCEALDRITMSCSIYENRPKICRDLDMGGIECISEREGNV